MSLEQVVRASLWVTAPFNFLAGYLFAVPNSAFAQVLQLPGSEVSLYTLMSGALIAMFGGCYIWLAMQERLHAPLLFVGASGKLLAVLIAWATFLTGGLALLPAVLISGDLLFVGLWFYFLSKRS